MKKILIHIDHNEDAELVARKGILLARNIDADIILLHTVTPEFIKKDVEEFLEARKTKIRKLARKLMNSYNCAVTVLVLEGAPEEKIIEIAQNIKMSAIVIGTHHRVKTKRRKLQDSVKKLMHYLEIPIVTISNKV